MTTPDEPTKPNHDEEQGPYRIADEDPAPDRVNRPRVQQRVGGDADAREDVGRGVDAGAEPDTDTDTDTDVHSRDDGSSLPPPIVRAGTPLPWLVIAGVCTALILISWLAGVPQLTLPNAEGVTSELAFAERIDGLARTVIFLPLATLAAAFGLVALAFLHQRPIGDPATLFAKSLAIVCMAALLWLIPTEIRFVKQMLNVLGVPLAAALIAVPVLRLHPRDALLAAGFALLGLALLVFGAWVVVWSMT